MGDTRTHQPLHTALRYPTERGRSSTGVREVLLDRLHHDQSVHRQYGAVQRTTRRNQSLKNDDEVLRGLEDEGIPRERVMAVNREKVDDALDVTELADSAVYEIGESEYVRKADVDEETKETRPRDSKISLR